MTLRNDKFASIRKVGSDGWNIFSDSQDIKDTELSDVLNMVFDKGYPEPRRGSTLKWEKPDGETNDALCAFKAVTSDGLNYGIVVYGNNFYVRDETNDQWIQINQSYTPSVSYIDLMYGYINWNAGRGADALYACNGQEDFIKWPIAMGYVTSATLAASTTLTLDDASYFPTTGGDLVIKEANLTAFTVSYTSRTGNVLTLSGTLGTDVGAGTGVTFQIDNVSAMAKGKVMARHQRRLFVANYPGGETALKYSVTEDPEDFTVGSTVTSGGALILSDGNGEITGLDDFGEYLAIEKQDSLHKFAFVINQDLSAKLDQILPIVTDNSVGPLQPWAKIKKNNILYFPTEKEGIFAISPDTTGAQTSTNTQVISMPIQPYVTSLNFENTRVAAYEQKLHWSIASNTVNDYVLVYDVLRNVWTRFNNWNVKDWLPYNDELLFVSRTDGNVYQCYADNYIDNNSQYECFFYTKRWDMGDPAKPKTQALVFLQGYITSTTNLYVDVLFNEGGTLQTVTYKIDGSGQYVSQPISEALAMSMLGLSMLGTGSVTDLDDIGIFRLYLNIPVKYGYYVLGLKFYTNAKASRFGVTGISHAPYGEFGIPSELCMDAIGGAQT